MRYVRLIWTHDSPGDPVEIWSEIGPDRAEIRKLEVFSDGRIACASATENPMMLADQPWPTPEEWADQDDIVEVEITAEAFELRWSRRALPWRTNPG